MIESQVLKAKHRTNSSPKRSRQSLHDREPAVVELLHLAASASDAGSTQQRLALAHLVTELLNNRQDRAIDRALTRAQSLGIDHILRQAVETASERTVVVHNGTAIELSLVAIPIITAFDEDVPASQFEAALSRLDASNGLADVIGDSASSLPTVMLLPKLFRLDELQAMPPSLVRRACVSLIACDVTGAITALLFDRHMASHKRSAAFLRYLIGRQQTFQQRDGANKGQLCASLQNLLKREIKRYLGLACRVEVIDTGSFHEALYSGMWRYQDQRLDQIIRASRARASRGSSVEARLLSHGELHPIALRIEFFAGDQPIGGHGYRLTARPSEAANECVTRITRRLAIAGVRTRALMDIETDEPVCGTRRRRAIATSMIAIPI